MSDMTIRFWGTRGSIPVPGPQTLRYGGNTTCMEVRSGDTIVVIDAGTGIRQLGDALSSEYPNGCHMNLLFTHTHWDHIQGLPFFASAYNAANHIDVYGKSRGLRSTLEGQMKSAYFPIEFSAMAAGYEFQQTGSNLQLGPMRVSTMPLPHPGGCQGYRFETQKSTLVVATDCELRFPGTHRKGKTDNDATADQMLRFFARADVIVIDCQYTDHEYQQKAGWGHNSISTVVDLCRRVHPGTLVLTHHDPASDDQKIDGMVGDAARRLRHIGIDTRVVAAREHSMVLVGQSTCTALAS